MTCQSGEEGYHIYHFALWHFPSLPQGVFFQRFIHSAMLCPRKHTNICLQFFFKSNPSKSNFFPELNFFLMKHHQNVSSAAFLLRHSRCFHVRTHQVNYSSLLEIDLVRVIHITFRGSRRRGYRGCSHNKMAHIKP